MKSRFSAIAFVLLLSVGCATSGKMGQVSIGMTRAEVIDALGDPVSTSGTGGTEYLNYHLSETSEDVKYEVKKDYYVRLVNGRVDSFGRLGDSDSTQDSTGRSETDSN
jgi:outer membrane protein assembly factor BamE (lipoprotein component of BamABCDE complex)